MSFRFLLPIIVYISVHDVLCTNEVTTSVSAAAATVEDQQSDTFAYNDTVLPAEVYKLNCSWFSVKELYNDLQRLQTVRDHLKKEFLDAGVAAVADAPRLRKLHRQLERIEFVLIEYIYCILKGRWWSFSPSLLVFRLVYGLDINTARKLLNEMRTEFLRYALQSVRNFSELMRLYKQIEKLQIKWDLYETKLELLNIEIEYSKQSLVGKVFKYFQSKMYNIVRKYRHKD